MTFKGWPQVTITTDNGEKKPAIAPLIISASRSTDIPAFYGPWFMKRLDAGYVKWTNPWSGKPAFVSLAEARVFVFWSKNPAPFLPYLKELDKRGLHYYFHMTLNDYETEGFEKGVPPLRDRVETFKRLAGMIDGSRVLWRFDPLILTDALSPEHLCERVYRLGASLSGNTERCTISFLACYKKVLSNLTAAGVGIRPWDAGSRSAMLRYVAALGRELKLSVFCCAGEKDLCADGIVHGKCIDDDLIIRLFGHDEKLMAFFGVKNGETGTAQRGDLPERNELKDKGQRPLCNCTVSKDIGSYNTCGHQCAYCYANTSALRALKNCRNASLASPGSDSIGGG
jgi:hypothetical protein